MSTRRGVTAWVAALAVLAVAGASVLIAQPLLRGDPARGIPAVLVGVGFAMTAALLWHQDHQRGNALLFAAMSAVWLCNLLAVRGAGAVTPFAHFVSVQVDVLAAAALLRYPADRLESASRRFVVVSGVLIGAVQAATLVTALPGEVNVPSTAPWPELLQGHGWGAATAEVRNVVFSVLAAIFLALLIRRWTRMAPLERRTLVPVLATASFVGLATTPFAINVLLPRAHQHAIYTVRSYAAVAVAVAFVVSAIQMSLARTALVTLVNRLQVPSSASNIRSALQEVLLDRQLDVLFALPDRQGWVDDRGVARELTTSDHRLPILTRTADDKPLAVVLVDDRLDRYRTLLDAAITVSRFALENARLEAHLRAQLRAVREARSRLLSTGLEQRRQLERDLHDGAQQRLMAIGLRLGALESTVRHDPIAAEAIAQVRKELHVALEELRDLARGIYPAVLSQAGLAPALEAVTERLPLRVETEIEPQRWHPDVESAAYLVVCEALTNVVRYAGECAVRISIHQSGGGLTVSVADDGAGDDALGKDVRALDTLRDRVAALGGELQVRSAVGAGTMVQAVIPCE